MRPFHSIVVRLLFAGLLLSCPLTRLRAGEPAPVHPLPTQRQLKWHEAEFYAFFHYGMNTFTGQEWGYGDEPETLYAPKSRPDPRQWLEVAKAAGMTGGIAVAKHHDGFCLWPTATTTHSILRSPGPFAQVDIPLEFSNAARELGMKYGFYVSPWDRNSALYGDGTDRYTREVFHPQCLELARYGADQFEMWFDGANGGDGYYGGAREKRAIDPTIYYDMPNLRYAIHELMPDCLMWGLGEEARWIGNEAGWAGETNWSLGFSSGEEGDIDGYEWSPGEADVSLSNDGWFWHEGQSVKSPDDIWKIYMETVGRNANLILNITPDDHGRVPADMEASLRGFGKLLAERFATDLAPLARVSASATRDPGEQPTRTFEASNLTDGDTDTYWATDDGVTNAWITFLFDETTNVHAVTLMEAIRLGQRVKEFEIEISADGEKWSPISYGATTTIGYKRIVPLNGSTSDYGPGFDVKGLRVHIKDAKASPALHTISIY